MHDHVVSKYTWTIFGLAIGITAAAALLVTLGVGGEFGTIVWSDVHEVLVVSLAAGAILRSALMLGPATPVGRTWLLIGVGTALYAVGDAVWTVIEVGMRAEVPYPGLPDVFYLLEYPFVAAGIISAGIAYKGLVDVRRPAIIATVLGVVLSAIVYVGLLAPTVVNVPDIGTAEKVFSVLYPLGDVMLMIAPAVFVLLVVGKLGGGLLARPWWAVAAGACVIAFTDTAYSWLSAYDLYASGNPIDYGWSIGHALIMLGALVARDIAAPHS